MGYRANVVTHHRQYGTQPFANWEKFQNYHAFLLDTYEEHAENFYENDNQDFYEIPKIVFEKEIERLSKLPPDTIVSELDEEAQYVIVGLKEALKDAVKEDDYVALEWY